MLMRNSLIAILLILVLAVARFLPHPANFTPVMSVALFGSAVFFNRYLGIAMAILAMILSDAVYGMHSTLPFVYLAMALAGIIGFSLREKRTPLRVLTATLAGSVVFFLVTNLGVFLMQDLYPHTATGLLTCYTMALPFFRNSLAGDVFFAGLLFSLHYLAVRRQNAATAVSAA